MLNQNFEDNISPEQMGELVKRFTVNLSRRSKEEASFLLEGQMDHSLGMFLDEKSGFSGDWVKSEAGYPKTYKGLRPIEEQVNMVADYFGIDRRPALKLLKNELPELPEWSEGWVAFPIVERLKGEYWKNVFKALSWVKKVYTGLEDGTFPYCGGTGGLDFKDHICPHHLNRDIYRPSPRKKFLYYWDLKMKGKILVVPAQMGKLRRGQSDRMVRAHCLRRDRSEFPLGAFEMACLIAMHPERVPQQKEDALEINAPGDEWNEEGRLKSRNCFSNQMSSLSYISSKSPSLVVVPNHIRDEARGPITASGWNVAGFLS